MGDGKIKYGGEVPKLSIETIEKLYAAMLWSPAPIRNCLWYAPLPRFILQCEKYPDPGPKFKIGDKVRIDKGTDYYEIMWVDTSMSAYKYDVRSCANPGLGYRLEEQHLELAIKEETKMEKTSKAVTWCEKYLKKDCKYLIISLEGKVGLLRYNEATTTWRLKDWGVIRNNVDYDVAEAPDLEGCYVREVLHASTGTSAFPLRIDYPEDTVTIMVSKEVLDKLLGMNVGIVTAEYICENLTKFANSIQVKED